MAGPVLWLLRHGKAADAITFRGGDAARPLTPRGERQSEASGAELARHAPTIDAILTSPRVRALQTATIAAAAHGSAPEPIVIDELGGDYGLSGLLALASPWLEADGSPNVVIVGHNPTLSILVHELTGDERGLSTGALAGIDLRDRRLLQLFKPPKTT
jgi:phosphohistidine phosphatase SixA